MKQQITVEQLNGLSEKGKKKLQLWLWGRKYILSSNQPVGFSYMMSIGQMVEFLEDKFGKGMGIYGYPANHSIQVPNGGYSIKIIPEKNGGGVFGTTDGYLSKGQEELCDALWDAVKEVLEK